MTPKYGDYIITTHLRERFLQRSNKKYLHLQNCRSAECYNCHALLIEIRREAGENRIAIDEAIRARLEQTEENKSYLNNTGFMEWYFQKYGYDKRFEFLVHDDLLFVVVHDNGKKVIVTCVSSKTHIAGRCTRAVQKFNKVKTKEEKQAEVLAVR
jgi:hypothetical protein